MIYWRYYSFLALIGITHLYDMANCALRIHRWRIWTSTRYVEGKPESPQVLRGCRRCRRTQLYWDDRWHEVLGDPHFDNIDATFKRAREIEMARVRRDWKRGQRQLRSQQARYGIILPDGDEL